MLDSAAIRARSLLALDIAIGAGHHQGGKQGGVAWDLHITIPINLAGATPAKRAAQEIRQSFCYRGVHSSTPWQGIHIAIAPDIAIGLGPRDQHLKGRPLHRYTMIWIDVQMFPPAAHYHSLLL